MGNEQWTTQLALEATQSALWDRIQQGEWPSPIQAKAALKVYEHIEKALDITRKELLQLPLVATPEE